jgi:phosphoserine phosphatase
VESHPTKWLVVFDMDGTLLPGTTSAREISRIAGALAEISELEQRYSLNEVDSMAFSVEALRLWGSEGEGVFRRAWDAAPKLRNIDQTLDTLHRNGAVTCLITMAHRAFAECFSSFQHIYSSDYGQRIINPEDKPRIASMLASEFNVPPERIAAFGDSHSDIPLFRTVTHSVAINGSDDVVSLARHCYIGTDCSEAAALVFPDWFGRC